MNTCNTCKYWSVAQNIINNVADCDRPNCKADTNITFDIEVTANDDSGLDYIVKTSGNFGCILHTPKK